MSYLTSGELFSALYPPKKRPREVLLFILHVRKHKTFIKQNGRECLDLQLTSLPYIVLH